MCIRARAAVDEIRVVDRRPNLRKVVLDQHHENVDLSVGKAASVGSRKMILCDDSEEDEDSFLVLLQEEEKKARDEIERLAVPNIGIVQCKA